MQGWVWALRFVGLGWFVAIMIVLGALVGRWLDRKWETSPWLLLTGILAGSFLAFYGLYQMLAPAMKMKGKDKGKP